MKTLLQLLREFLLPLTFAIVWTIFNFVGQPDEKQDIRYYLNVFGPTFFFVSWLVAQWFRVKKQQRVEDGITEIRRDVKAIHAPLLPAGVFLTLRANVDDDTLGRLFKEEDGYRSFGTDQPVPPPPEGPPAGVSDARLHRPGCYIDYEGGVFKAAGIYIQGHPGYNTVHRAITHTLSVLSNQRLEIAQLHNDPILAKPSVQIEIFLGGPPKTATAKPSLVLISANDSHKIGSVCALDTTIVSDHYFHLLPKEADQSRTWSTIDLKDTFIRATLKFFYIEPFFSVPQESWPEIQNLQLWLGPKADRVLTFSNEQLTTQIIELDPEPLAGGSAVCVRAVFGLHLDLKTYEKCLLSSA